MILEGPFGTLPVEIKFGSVIKPRQIQTLKKFVYQNDLPLGIVINNSDKIELVADRILQLPANYSLTPFPPLHAVTSSAYPYTSIPRSFATGLARLSTIGEITITLSTLQSCFFS